MIRKSCRNQHFSATIAQQQRKLLVSIWYKLRKNALVKLSFVYWERDAKYMRSIEWNIYINTKLKVIKEYTRTVETASHLSYWKKGSVTAQYLFLFLSFINHCYIINYILALKNSLERYAEAILLYGIPICVEMLPRFLIICRKFR